VGEAIVICTPGTGATVLDLLDAVGMGGSYRAGPLDDHGWGWRQTGLRLTGGVLRIEDLRAIRDELARMRREFPEVAR
jgi:hypothetical protein